jgi:hypothetical protein
MPTEQESSAHLTDVLDQLQAIQRALATPSKQDSKESRSWQLLVLVVPVVLTSILAALGYAAQARLQEGVESSTRLVSSKIARSDELFKSRIALGEELYKRRLNIYEKAYVRMLALQRGIREYQTTRDQRAMNNSLAALNSYYNENAIYLSTDLHAQLVDLWYTAGQIGRPGGPPDAAVQPQLDKIERTIARDLYVGELLRVQNAENE